LIISVGGILYRIFEFFLPKLLERCTRGQEDRGCTFSLHNGGIFNTMWKSN